MPAKKVQLKDNLGVPIYPKTVGSEVYQLDNSGDITNTLWAEKGAEKNTIASISVNNTAVSPDANRNVNITIAAADTYTISAVSSPDAAYSAQYKLMKSAGGTGTHTQVGDTINIPKDMVISSGSVVDVIFDTTDDHLYDTSTNPYTDVTTLIVGSGTATAADAGKYIKLVVANATNDKIYISVSDLVDTYTAGNGIDITSNAISVVGDSTKAINVDASNGVQVVADTTKALSIDSTNGLQVKADTTKALSIDSTNGLQVVADTNYGLEIHSTNGLRAKLAATTPCVEFDGSGGLQLKVDSTSYGLQKSANGIGLKFHSATDLEETSTGLHLKGESSTNFVAYYSVLT